MSSVETQTSFSSTSASGSMLMRQARPPMLVGWMLVGFGTSTAHALPPDVLVHSHRAAEQTSSGVSALLAEPAGAAIGELRRLSGLTWDQLARVFNVSRRSLHFWASGKTMAASNEEHLQRILGVIRKIDRGSASANRAALLGVREDGSLPFDMLTVGDYEHAVSLLGVGEAKRIAPPKMSAAARAARAPRPPEELVDALQDRIHPTSGRLLSTKPVRALRRK